VKFMLEVEEMLHSEFVTVMDIAFTKELVKNALNFDDSQDSPAPFVQKDDPEPAPQPMQPPVMPSVSRPKETLSAPEVKKEEPKPNRKPAPAAINVKPVRLQSFDDESPIPENGEETDNFQLIMGVPLDITVEIGRTRMPVKNILEVRQGSIVELDRQAGDPVDVIVNGQLIAKGDVVIVDDNFGVRITEILSKRDLSKKIY